MKGATQATGLGPDSREWWDYAMRSNYRQARWHLARFRAWAERYSALVLVRRGNVRKVRMCLAAMADHAAEAVWWRGMARWNRDQRDYRFAKENVK